MNTGEWRNGLFDGVCGADSCGMCLGAWFCSCFLYGRTAKRLEHFPSEEKPSLCNSGCWLMCGAGCCHLHWLVALLKRSDERHKFGVNGDGCTDCLVSYFCYPCTLAQMETEVKARAKLANQAAMSQGYSQVPGGMTYQQPPPPQGYPQQGYPQQQSAPPYAEPKH